MIKNCYLSLSIEPSTRKETPAHLPVVSKRRRGIHYARVTTCAKKSLVLPQTGSDLGGRPHELEAQIDSFDLSAASKAVSEVLEVFFVGSSRLTVFEALESAKLSLRNAGTNPIAAGFDHLLAEIECLMMDEEAPS